MRLVLATCAALTMLAPGPATAQTAEPVIVVKAPKSLDPSAAKEWAQLNKEAKKLAKRLTKLRAEALDDEQDVAEATRALENAQDKLEDEQRDQARTARRFADAKKDVAEIAPRRAALRSGL